MKAFVFAGTTPAIIFYVGEVYNLPTAFHCREVIPTPKVANIWCDACRIKYKLNQCLHFHPNTNPTNI